MSVLLGALLQVVGASDTGGTTYDHPLPPPQIYAWYDAISCPGGAFYNKCARNSFVLHYQHHHVVASLTHSLCKYSSRGLASYMTTAGYTGLTGTRFTGTYTFPPVIPGSSRSSLESTSHFHWYRDRSHSTFKEEILLALKSDWPQNRDTQQFPRRESSNHSAVAPICHNGQRWHR